MRVRIWVQLAVVLLCGHWASASFAQDTITGLLDGEVAEGSIVEIAHNATLQMHEGYAKVVVERTIYNRDQRPVEAVIEFGLPEGAVVVGVRTRDESQDGEAWYDGELLTTEQAEKRYWRVAPVAKTPTPRTLLAWESAGWLALRVFPVNALGRRTVEYTMLLPTESDGSRHAVTLDSQGTEKVPWTVRLRPQDGELRAGVLERSESLAVVATAMTYQYPNATLEVSWEPPAASDTSFQLARLGNGAKMLEVASLRAGRLGELPKAPDVVFLLDCSISVSDGARVAARHAIAGYLSHVPDARVQLVTFNRQTSAVFSEFLPVPEASARLEAVTPMAANGSNLDRALEKAAELLSGRRSREKRVLLFSDFETSSAISPGTLSQLTRGLGAVVHFVEVPPVAWVAQDTAKLSPQYDSPWFAATETTNGVTWLLEEGNRVHARLSTEAMEAAALELVRPTGIRELSIDVGHRNVAAVPELREGHWLRNLAVVEREHRPMVLSGRVWARPISLIAHSSVTLAQTWAALVFGTALRNKFTPSEQIFLARSGGAVTAGTAYVSAPPQSRAAPGISPADRWGDGLEVSGITEGRGDSAGDPVSRDYEGLLQPSLSRMWKDCAGEGHARVTLESTHDEVVLVEVAPENLDGEERPGPCLSEAIWNFRLPQEFERSGFHRLSLQL